MCIFIQPEMSKYTHRPNLSAKSERQAKLLEIVRSEAVTTQAELSERLEQAGLACTQVSVSRDIRELGLVKRNGHYMVPEDITDSLNLDNFTSTVRGFIKSVRAAGSHLIVVATLPGTAHSVAMLLDRVQWTEIVGTVAGDDTIFIAVSGLREAQLLTRKLEALMKG